MGERERAGGSQSATCCVSRITFDYLIPRSNVLGGTAINRLTDKKKCSFELKTVAEVRY